MASDDPALHPAAAGTARRRRHLHRVRPGSSPGTPIVDPQAPPPTIHVFAYGPEEVEESDPATVAELAALVGRRPVTWIDVTGLGDAGVLAELGRTFRIHPLALEDVVHVHQRSKVEVYGEDVFVVARMSRPGDEVETEQVSFLLKPQLLLTFQERPGDNFGPVRERIRTAGLRIRQSGPDYLAYALLDAIIDGYFPLLDLYGDRLDDLETRIIDEPGEETLEELHHLRRQLIGLRKAFTPHREAINSLMRDPIPGLHPETQLYLRDCYDHALRVTELLESYREYASTLMDVQLSAVGNRTNEVMKVLTMIATLFIPLSFLAGLYGMNFNTASPWNMPELTWRYGYPFVLGTMGAVALGFLWYFRRKGWF